MAIVQSETSPCTRIFVLMELTDIIRNKRLPVFTRRLACKLLLDGVFRAGVDHLALQWSALWSPEEPHDTIRTQQNTEPKQLLETWGGDITLCLWNQLNVLIHLK